MKDHVQNSYQGGHFSDLPNGDVAPDLASTQAAPSGVPERLLTTKQLLAWQDLIDSSSQLANLLDDSLLILDEDFNVIMANYSVQKLIGLQAESKDKSIFDLMKLRSSLNQEEIFLSYIMEQVATKNKAYRNESLYMVTVDNEKIPIILTVYPINDSQHPDGIIILIRDLRNVGQYLQNSVNFDQLNSGKNTNNAMAVIETSRTIQDLSEELAYIDTHDALTALYNRKYFILHLEKLLESGNKFNCEHVLVYIDLDKFKVINDNGGQQAGDELLKQVAKLLQSKVRKWDVVARMGDDEFALILLYCSKKHAMKISETVRDLIRSFEFIWDNIHYELSASFGVAPFDGQKDDLKGVLAKADTACQMAKEKGCNHIYLFESEDESSATRYGEITAVADINKALANNRFVLYAQEIQAITKTKSDGEHYEILVRMLDDNNDIIPPVAFLPAAERYNLIGHIDRWVIENTCKLLSKYSTRLRDLDIIAINLSAQSLTDEQLNQYILDVTAQYQIPAEKICFEITETGAISNLSAAIKFIKSLRDKGFLFALDDFGSGLSSFGYLKNLPVDYVKIDGMFVRDIAQDPIDYAMVKSINEIGHVMKKKTIAEFVEDDDSLEALRGLGVDYAQGYGIGKPGPFEDVLKRPGS